MCFSFEFFNLKDRGHNFLPVPATFKLKKTELQKVGYDWTKTEDQIFVVDKPNRTYVPMTKELFDKISTGQMQF